MTRELLACAAVMALAQLPAAAIAHELEKTQVVVTVSADGRYVVDILNDANWLWMTLAAPTTTHPSTEERDRQLAGLTARFAPSVTLAFDGRAAAADRVEYFPPLSDDRAEIGGYEPGLMRVTGTAPAGARTIRLTYALVVDPFPVTARTADGASSTTWARAREASSPIVLAGMRSTAPKMSLHDAAVPAVIAIAFAALAALRCFEWSHPRRPAAPRSLHARAHHG